MTTDSLFAKRVTVRKYKNQIDNISGDRLEDNTNYREFNILAEIQILDERDELVRLGLLEKGDAEGFFRGIYDEDANGNSISPPIAIETNDEVLFRNKWYRVKNVVPETWLEGEIVFWDAQLILVGRDDNDFEDYDEHT